MKLSLFSLSLSRIPTSSSLPPDDVVVRLMYRREHRVQPWEQFTRRFRFIPLLEIPSHSMFVPLLASHSLLLDWLVDAALPFLSGGIKPRRMEDLSRHERRPNEDSWAMDD